MLQAKIKLAFVLVFSAFVSNAQLNILNHDLEWMFNEELSKGDSSWNACNNSLEAHFIFEELSSDSLEVRSKYKFIDWVFNKSIYGVDKEDYTFRLNPIFSIQRGQDGIFSTRRGGYARGTIGSKFKWVTSFYENNQSFDPRITNLVKNTAVAPGEAEVKNPFKNSEYSVSSGGFVYTFSKFYKLSAGHGKNFIGNGYRSLLLSDASNNYPFLRNELTIGKVKYTSIVGEFIDFTNNLVGDGLKQKKYGSFHFLDVLATKRLKLAFFESVIWAGDSSRRSQLDVNYLNPFVLFRPLEYNIGSPDNMLIGLNGSWDVFNSLSIYGQLVLDELHSENLINNPTWWANKYGYQAGIKLHNLPIKNLLVFGEHNSVRPFTYSHKSSALNYGHNYNALAHPFGANFREFIGIVNYRKKRLNLNSKLVYIFGGEEETDSISNGKDIFKPYQDRANEDGYSIGYGVEYQQLFWDTKVSYILNPKYMLMLELGYQNRTEWVDGVQKNHHYLYGGFRTSLFNLYYDY